MIGIIGFILLSAADDLSDVRAASDAHVASMDAWFGCAFAAVRAARSEALPADLFAERLARSCGKQEAELRRRSAAFTRARGLSPEAARRKANDDVDFARDDMVRLYSGE